MKVKNSFIGWIAVAIAVHATASEVKKDASTGHDRKNNMIERNNDIRSKEVGNNNAQKQGKSKIQRVAQNRADGKAEDSNKEFLEAHVSKVLKERKPVARIAQNVAVNFNNVITNVCHPENSQGAIRRRKGAVARGARPSVNRGGGSNSRSVGICDSTSTINGILGIGAAFAGAGNPAVGIAAGVGASAVSMIFSMSCPSSVGGTTKLREEMIEAMGDQINVYERDEIANEMEHIAEMLEHDEIFPLSIATAEAYSRDLSLLQDRAYEAFTWDGLPIFAAIAKAHILMKEYIVLHSFKISDGCGLERLESLERAKGIAFEEFQNIADDFDVQKTTWFNSHYSVPTRKIRREFNKFPECYYSWTTKYGHDQNNYGCTAAEIARATQDSTNHFELIFNFYESNYESIWTENVVNFRNQLLSDSIEDDQACGQIGDEELACNSATGKTVCDQNQKICRLPSVTVPHHNLNTIHAGVDQGKSLGVISQPGQNFQISFKIWPLTFLSNFEDLRAQTIIRGTNTEVFGNYGRTYRHPLIYWTDGKIVVAANDLDGNNNLGYDSPQITMNQWSSITVTFLKDKIVYCNEHDCYSTEAPIDKRPAFDNMYLNLGDNILQGSPGLSLHVKEFQFTKIMDGYKIFQGAPYSVTDYKISDYFQSPTSAQPPFAIIPNPTSQFQISFTIELERAYLDAMPGHKCVLRFKPDTNERYDYYPYFALVGGNLIVMVYPSTQLPTREIPLNEKVQVKYVDLGHNSFLTYVNGEKFATHVRNIRPALGSQLKVFKTFNDHNLMGDDGVRISNLHYTYLYTV